MLMYYYYYKNNNKICFENLNKDKTDKKNYPPRIKQTFI